MEWPPESTSTRVVLVLAAALVVWKLCDWMEVPFFMALIAVGAGAIVVARAVIRAN